MPPSACCRASWPRACQRPSLHIYVIGCNDDPYEFCPFETLARAEMAVVIVRAYHDEHYAYEPPQPQEQHFDDVPLNAWYARWIHQLWLDG